MFRVTVLSTFYGYHGNFKISGHLTDPLHITDEQVHSACILGSSTFRVPWDIVLA